MNCCKAALAGLCLGLCTAVQAAPPAAGPDAEAEARFRALTSELRCLVCQNQTIADSNAALAVDLRNEVRRLLREGASDAAIVDFMVARYGDFVLYRPPLKSTTLPLWGAPALFLLLGLGAWTLQIRAGSRAAPPQLSAEERARAAALLDERAALHGEERSS